MPWTSSDAKSHIKGLSEKQAKAWADIANSALSYCQKKDGKDCEGYAIRTANSKVKNVGESLREQTLVSILDEAFNFFEPAVEVQEASQETAEFSLVEGAATTEFDIEEAPLDLTEKAVSKEGLMMIKLIRPGMGTSGYYPKKTLQRDGPKAFKKGTQMFLDHPTAQEEAERPEGSVTRLAATTVEDAKYLENGPDGEGLYALADPLKTHRQFLEDASSHIGVSIRALGRGREGQVAGKATKIIEELTHGKSVDFVTRAGAGGKVVDLFESARNGQTTQKEEPSMAVEEADVKADVKALREALANRDTELTEAKSAIARLTERELIREAADYIRLKVKEAGSDLPDFTRERVCADLIRSPRIKEGKFDQAAQDEAIKESVRTETEYLAKVTGSGRVHGMNTRPPEFKESDFEASFSESMKSLGISEDVAVQAAKGRN